MKTTNNYYCLDNKNIIVSVSNNWNNFAEENDGLSIFSENVIGKSIWDFISGNTTKMWLDCIFQLARLRKSKIEKTYRCDSPDIKRYMKMIIIPDIDGFLKIEHQIMSTEVQETPVFIYASPTKNDKFKKRCSVCGRILQDNCWYEPANLNDSITQNFLVIYTVCNECKRSLPGL